MSQISLLNILLRDPTPLVWLAVRTDGQMGNGSVDDPFDASTATRFDALMNGMPANAEIHLGPGLFKTTGYTDGPPVTLGWSPKPGQKIIGSGFGVTTLKLVVANQITDAHYWAIAARPGTLLDLLEVSDLTIDANNPAFAKAASGAIRIMGSHCRIRRTKAINFGTKTDATGCFVFSLITADASANIAAETVDSGIEDCIAVQPSFENRREVTIFHLGGTENATTHAQLYGKSHFLRSNFVDCASPNSPPLFPTELVPNLPVLTVQTATIDTGTHSAALRFGRPHHWLQTPGGNYVRIGNPNSPMSRWNGHFAVIDAGYDGSYTLQIDLGTNPPDGTDEASLLIAGVEFRALSVNCCCGAIIEGNQLHNCWIGGPYQDLLNTKDVVIRGNSYKNVVAGPFFNLGNLSGSRNDVTFQMDSTSGIVSGITSSPHGLLPNVWIYIQSAGSYNGFRQITSVTRTTFTIAYSGPAGAPTGSYQTLWGIDKLLIENNIIELADLDATEYALPNLYPATGRRPTAILVNDTPAAGPLSVLPVFVHGDIIVQNNQIRYLDGIINQAPSALPLAGTAMQIAGAKNLIVKENVLESLPLNPLQNIRCGNATYFENKRPVGTLVQGANAADGTHYSELETLAEDAMLLNML